MIVKNCFNQDVDLRKFSKIILRERGDEWRGKSPKYIIGAESDPVSICDGQPMRNQVLLEEFDDFEAAKRSKLRFEALLRNEE